MISIWHLLWIVPLISTATVFAIALATAAKERDKWDEE